MLTVRTSENTVITSFRLISERQDFSSVRTGENTVRARARIHSEFVKNGKDLDFGRQHNLTLDFSQPPYYAVKTQPGIQVTLGGIDVNNNMQVIKKDGGFFPNLYAAGEVTYDGSFRPGPTAVGLYQGHIAAQNILRKSN